MKLAQDTSGALTPGGTGHPWLLRGALAAILTFHFAVNLWYLSADNHVIRTDEETHMLAARQYYDTVVQENHGTALKFVIALSKIRPGNPAHPPLLPVMGAGIATVAGYSTDAFTLANTFLFLALILGCYFIAKLFLPPWGAVLAAFIVSFAPGIFHASRFFMTDYPAATVTVWAVYALLRSNYYRNTGWVFFFAVLTGLGILARIVSFLYFLLPAAIVAGIGLLLALTGRGTGEKRPDWAALRAWALHCTLTVVVSAGIFGPWYFHNLEPFYQYWTSHHPSAGPVTIARDAAPAPPPAPAPAAAPGAPEVETPEAAAPKETAPGRPPLQFKPRLKWHVYGLHLVNNTLFLLIAALGVIGAALAVALRRFRSFTVLLMLVWVAGAYALMTVLIKFSVARYALPIAPAFAIFAAVPFVALPAGTVRRIAVGALGVCLLFQYGNLTFASYGPLARLHLPVTMDRHLQSVYDDPGLTVFKDSITYGYSYSGLGPVARNDFAAWGEVNTVQACNYKDRLFLAMIAQEMRREAPSGQFANFVRLGQEMRGMDLDQRHYWHGTPYQRPDMPAEALPVRRLRSITMAAEPEGLAARLPEADYVVYSLPLAEAEKEAEWLAYLSERGFEPVESFELQGVGHIPARFVIERFGYVPARIYGLLSRTEVGLIHIKGRADIEKLDFFELYYLLHSPAMPRLAPDLQVLARSRFTEFLNAFPPPQPINEHLTYIGMAFAPVEDGMVRFHFIFRVNRPILRDWRMFFHGRPTPGDLHHLPPEFRAQGYMDWNFNPQPPTTTWKPGDYMLVSQTVSAPPIPLDLKIGFFSKEEGFFGASVGLGQLDFGQHLNSQH